MPITLQATYSVGPEQLLEAVQSSIAHLGAAPGLTPWRLAEAAEGRMMLTAEMQEHLPGYPCDVALRYWESKNGETTLAQTLRQDTPAHRALFEQLQVALEQKYAGEVC